MILPLYERHCHFKTLGNNEYNLLAVGLTIQVTVFNLYFCFVSFASEYCFAKSSKF